ncbi:hypothetical protein wTpre_693 [Wolbachia endosymbiont of Trichogramma pretiosum]|nr:hypothetical protein wTpre_693 [Wolbachia endosymbiont of Trichogramma pretiosum]
MLSLLSIDVPLLASNSINYGVFAKIARCIDVKSTLPRFQFLR